MDDNFIALMDISETELQAAMIFRQLSGERNYPAMLEDTVNFVGASVSSYRKALKAPVADSEVVEAPQALSTAGAVPTGFWLDETNVNDDGFEDEDDSYSDLGAWAANTFKNWNSKPSDEPKTMSPGKELMLWRDLNAKKHQPMRLWDFVADTMSRIRETHPGATLEDVKFEMNADGSADMVIKSNEPIVPTSVQTLAERKNRVC